MSTTDPAGEGGGGGEAITILSTNVEQNTSPVTPVSGSAMPLGSQQQHPPPSPLSGCYLLVVLPEPHTAQHKDLILNRLSKGFLSWDKDSCHVDLEKELLALVAQAPEGEEARNGERLIQYATENLVTEVLIHPQTNTLLQCIRNLLASFTKHRHIIHAGYTFGGNGSWILQDGTFSVADFLDAFSEHEVQRVLRAYENSVTVDIHCAGVGDWATNRLSKEACTRSCRVRVNPDDVLTAGVPAITSFSNYIGQYLVAQTLDQLMEPSDVVGNIRFSHPTLYVFPGGQGDAALFGINGFNMLVDGGFARKACFWDFTRHLDRLDAVLVTRINNSNVGGMSSVLRKKKEMHVYPQIGHFFCNLVERRQSNSPDGDKDIDPLILNLTDIGQEMVVNLRHINLRAHPCYRDPDPINLYHKVGHGTLDMYVLSPSKDSREVREFVVKWHASDSKLFTGTHKKDSNNLTFPIQNLVSICALLVWQPANPEDTITRILFPGSTPQHKIFEGFERLKHLEFLKHPVCSAKSLSPSTSLATLRDKPAKQKLSLIEKESSKKISDVKKEKRETSEVKVGKGGVGGGGGGGGGDETPAKRITQGTPPIIPTKPQGAKIEVKTKKAAENKRIEVEVKEAKESKKIEKELKEVSKKEAVTKKEAVKMEKQTAEKPEKTEEKFEKREEESLRKSDAAVKSEGEKLMIVPPKESRVKSESKKKEAKEARDMKVGGVKVGRLEAVSAGKPKLVEKKAKQQSYAEKKETGVGVKSSPTTPKKSVNGVATKTEISKASVQRGKLTNAQKTTTALPAKSAKDANNRKVVEQKNIEKSAIKETTAAGGMAVGSTAKVSVKAKPMDRKPIGRRGKPVSPIKARAPGSPAKSTRSTPTTSVKSDKDGVVRKPKGDKGTADSSTVSTPSGIEPETSARLVEKSLIEKSEDISLDSIESKVLADLKEEREVVEEIEAVLQKAERIEETRKDDRFEGDDEITAEVTDKKQEEDITEEDVTAEIEDAPKKDSLRKGSQELTEEDEYLIVEKEEVYTEDSVQSGEGEQKHILDEAESEKAKIFQDPGLVKEKGEEEGIEEKERDESAEKESTGQTEAEAEADAKLIIIDQERKEPIDLSSDRREQLGEEEVEEVEEEKEEEEEEEVKDVITSASETKQKVEEKDDSGKKDSDDITKEPSSLSPDKLDSSEKKTTDTDLKPEVDQKEQAPEKLEESQERISTIESGATTTAPTLPEDERIPLDEIKEDIDEKHIIEEVKEKDASSKVKEEVATTPATHTVTTTASVAATTATTAIAATTATTAATAITSHITVTDTAVTSVPRAAPAATAKPDVPMFDVRQAVQCLQRDIVKTPDEVADLPVHEEVDPKLYRMEDFEKDKEEKALPPVPATAPAPVPELAPAPAPAQDVKEPPTPPVKEQKGVFSFFGKVADKFEKGIDKLTKKSKKEHDKDTDEKSSSKSSSPKEAKVQEKTLLEDVDMEKMFLKVSKPSEKMEASEEMEPKIGHVKDEEIIKEDTFETKVMVQHHRPEFEPVKDEIVQDVSVDTVPSRDKFDTSKDELTKEAEDTRDSQAEKEGEEIIAVVVEEEADEIQALLEEASKKFKTVKDSLRDSLESLEGKIGDESVDLSGEIGAAKDTVKDTMDGVVERLERIKPQMENASPDTREPEKVKFDIPKDAEFEAEYEESPAVEGPVKDIKEAVRDVGEVLAGTAGIDIEDKAKDVTEIVRKVAQVLKGDDFLPEEKLLGETTASDRVEVASSLTAAKPESPISPKSLKSPISEYTSLKLDEISGKREGKIVVMPTNVGITEEFPQQEQEQVRELSIDETTVRVAPVPALTTLKSSDKRGIVQVDEEPCVKITTEKDMVSSPKDEAKDIRDAKEICEDILKQDLIGKSHIEVAPRQVESWKEDVIEAGLEDVCVKEVAKKLSDEEKAREEEVEVPTIGFHQKISPAKAEIVMVSPGSTPTSPKFVADQIHESTLASKETAIPVKLPAEIKAIVDNVDRPAADVIQQLVTNKTKITIEIIEYITTIKRLPRERVIYIIDELIVREKLSREDVVDNVDMFKLDEPITPQLRMELEEYIINEYVTKGKRITIRVVEEISIKMLVSKTIVIRIIKDIMVEKSIDVSTDDLCESQTEDVETKEGKEESATLHRVEEKLSASTEKEFTTKEQEEEGEEVEEGEEEEKEEEEEDISRIDAKEAKEAEAAKVEVTIQAFVFGEQPVSRSVEEEEEDLEEDGFVSIGRKVSKETIDDFEAVEQEYKVRDVPVTSFDDSSPAVPQKLLEIKEKDYAEDAVEDTASDVVEASEKFVHETKEKIDKERLDVDTAIDITLDKQGGKVEDTEERDTTSQLTQVSETLDAVEKYLDEAKEKVDSKIMLVEERATTDISAAVTAISDSDGGELGTFEPVKETDTSQVSSSTISRESPGTEHVPTAFQPMKEEAKSETPDKDEAKQTEMDATRSADKKVERVVGEQVLDKIEESTQVAGAAPAEESEREVMDRATDEKPKVQVPLKPEVKLADATGRAVEPKAEELIRDADKAEEAKPQESAEQKDDTVGEDYKRFDGHETDKLESTTKAEQMPPRDVTGSVIQQDEPMHETCVQVKVVTVEGKSKVDQDIGSVRRMLVTASSEDGGHETEICPTGSITFTKTPLTPDDSLKDASIKSTPDKDSLLLDKDSLRSGTSSPEKDSISEKSAAEIKDVVGKATPEDSLDMLPVGRHDSQDLEDSLEKAGVEEPRKVDSDSPSIDAEKTTPKSPQRSEELSSLGTVKPPLEADGTGKAPYSDSLAAEKIQPIKLTDEMVTKLPDAIVQTQESPAKLTKEIPQLKSPDQQLYISTNGISELALEATVTVSRKSPESADSEDIPPAETDTRSKSPTEKQELAKSPTGTKAAKSKAFERETTPSEITEPIREIEKSTTKSSSDKEDETEILGISGEKGHDTTPADGTILEDSKVDAEDKGKEPSIDREYGTIDIGETAERDVNDKKLRSPSIGSDKGDLKDSESSSADDSGKPSSIANEKSNETHENKEAAAGSKSPDTSTDKTEENISGQVAGDGHDDQLKRTESKVLVEAGDQALDVLKDEGKGKVTEIVGSLMSDTGDVPLLSTVEKSSTPISDTEEEKGLVDRPEKEKLVQQSTTVDQEVSMQVTEESRSERIKSPGGVSTTDKSKPLDVTDPQKQLAGRKVSSASDESQEAIDRSSSPSVESERHDVKELSEKCTDKVRSPSITSAPGESSIPGELNETTGAHSKSPSITGEPSNLKEVEVKPIDKSRSSSVTSVTEESREPMGPSKSRSVVGESVDTKGDDDAATVDKSRSPSVTSEMIDDSKSAGLKDVDAKIVDKSRSPSVPSVSSEAKEQVDHHRSESPSAVSVDIDSKATDSKSRSPSISSSPGETKDTMELSKSPSVAVVESPDSTDIAGAKLLVGKSSSPSVTSASVPEEVRESAERSKSPGVVSESADVKKVDPKVIDTLGSPGITITVGECKEIVDLKEVGATIADISTSSSIQNAAFEAEDRADHLKSPTIADESPDIKETEIDSKVVSTTPGESKEMAEHFESSSVDGESHRPIDVEGKAIDKSGSPSVASVPSAAAEPVDHSKSPSIADEAPELKQVDSKAIVKVSQSPSIPTFPGESKETPQHSEESPDRENIEARAIEKSTSLNATDYPIPAEPTDQIDGSKSSSIEGESSDLKQVDTKVTDSKARSPSISSSPGESTETVTVAVAMERSKSPSTAGESSNLIDVEGKTIDKSRSPSVTSVPSAPTELADRSKSPSIVEETLDTEYVESKSIDTSVAASLADSTGEPKGQVDRSKSPSIACELPDLKDVEARVTDKSRSPSVVSVPSETKDQIGRSKSPSEAIETPDLKEADSKSTGKFRPDHSKAPPSVAGESPDTKDLEARAVDKSRSPSVTSISGEPKGQVDSSKLPSIAGESPDLKDVDTKTTDSKSRSPSIATSPEESKVAAEPSKAPPSVAGESPDTKDLEARAVDKSRSPSVTSISGEPKGQVDSSKSPSIAGESPDLKDVDTKTTDSKSRSPSIATSPEESKVAAEPSKAPPSVAGESPDPKDLEARVIDKSRSPSVTSISDEPKGQVDSSKSPSIAGESSDLKEVDTKATDSKSRSPSTATLPEESKVAADHSKAPPSVAGESPDLKDIEERAIDKSRSPSVTSISGEPKGQVDSSKSPSIAGESPDLKDVDTKTTDSKSRSPSISTLPEESKVAADHSKAPPSVAGESPDLKDIEERAIDKSRSPSVTSISGEPKGQVDSSKSPSIAGESPDLKDVDTKTTDSKSRSPSISTLPEESKVAADHSKAPPFVAGESPDPKDLEARVIDKSRSPSVTSISGEPKGQVDSSKSPSIAGESPDLKEVDMKATDSKSRSPSTATLPEESKVAVDHSKAPQSVASESPDPKDIEGRAIDKSRSPSVTSISGEPKGQVDSSKSPSIAGESPDLKDVDTKTTDSKSRSPSTATSPEESKVAADHSKAPPSVAGESPDPKDIEGRAIDKSRSPSVTSISGEPKHHVDHSKSPSIAGELPDLKEVDTKAAVSKSRSPSIATLPAETKEAADYSKAPQSVTGKSPDPKDIEGRAIDKSRSPSVTSISGEPKDHVDHSKSPSIAGELPDLKEVDSIATDKSKSPGIETSPEESNETADHSMAPTLVAGQSPAPKDLEATAIDRSKSPSVTSISGEPKGQVEGSKSPSTVGETSDLKETDSKATGSKSRSPSISSSSGESKETAAVTVERSKSPSIAAESMDLKEAADRKVSDKSVSPSMPTSPGESPETAERSKSPSVARESPDPKDAEAEAIDKSRSLSAASVPGESSIDPVGRLKSPSIAGESLELHEADSRAGVKSRSSSIPTSPGESKPLGGVGESSESKDLVSKGTDQSIRSPSVTSVYSALTEPVDPSKSPSITGESADSNDAQAMSTDKSRASSVTSVSGVPKGQADGSKSPSIIDESPDLKDMEAKRTRDESTSPSVTSVPGESEGQVDRSKSPSISRESLKSPDLKEVDSKVADKSRSPSSTPGEITGTVAVEGSKSPSVKDTEAKTALDKSRSSSSTSIPGEFVVRVDRSKSPSIAGELPHLKDVESKGIDSRSRSPSVTSITEGVSREAMDQKSVEKSSIVDATDTAISTSPSVPSVIDDVKESEVREAVDENMIDKARSRQSVTSFCSDFIEEADRSRSPSGDGGDVGDDRKDVGMTDVAKPVAQSVAGVAEEPKGSDHQSKSLSPAGEEEIIDSVTASSVMVAKVGGEAATVAEMEGLGSTTASRFMEKGEKVVPDLEKEIFDRPQEDDKLSCADSPAIEKAVTDGSRFQSVAETDDKTPSTRSRAASVYEEKTPSMDEEKSSESSGRTEGRTSISIATTKVIDNVLGINDGTGKVTYAVSFGDASEETEQEDDIVKVTAEKKADIEKYILEEYICKKRKITSIMIEKIVMTYSVPEFVVIDIIETVLAREKERDGGGKGETGSDSILDLVDYKIKTSVEAKETIALGLQKKVEIEKYIMDEYVAKRKKITPNVLDEIWAMNQVPRPLLNTIVDEIIVKNNLERIMIIGTDVEKAEDEPKREISVPSKSASGIEFPGIGVAESGKTGDNLKSSSVMHAHEYRDAKDASGGSTSPSLCSEPIASDKSTQDSSARSEPRIDEEISISEEKRTEVEGIVEGEYISKAKKITGQVLEEIIVRTFLPRYIILEIIEEIILKKQLSRDSVMGVEIYQEDEPADESCEKEDDRYEKARYDYPSTKVSAGAEASVSDYPINYESQFHKAFVCGITEIRTTHITTLSGKSTPDMTRDGTPDSTSEPTASTVERIEDKYIGGKAADTHVSPDTTVSSSVTMHATESETQTVHALLKESKIDRSGVADVLESDAAAAAGIIKYDDQPDDTSGDKVIVVKKIIKREVVEQQEPEMVTETVTKQRISDEGDPETTIRKIIKREIIEQREPIVTRNVIERDVIVPDDVERVESSTEVEGREQGAKMIETRRTETQKTEIITDIASSIDGNRRPVRTAAAVIESDGSRGGSLKEGSETEKKTVERDGKDIVAQKDKRPASPLVRDITCESSGSVQLHPSGRSTPDRKPESRSLTGTPEGFRSGEIIRTIITTTKTVSDDGEIVTTTREVTETTNEKGETVVLAEKVDVKVDEYLPSRDAAESAISSIIDSIKSSELESDKARKKTNITEGGLHGSEKEQQSHSDDGGVGVGQSSSTTHAQQSAGTSRQLEQSIGKEEISVGFSAAAMSSSFYGELPAVPPQISAMKTFQEDVDIIRKSSDPIPIQADYTFKKFTVEKEYAGGYEEKADAKRYVDEADLDFEKALMERKEMKEPPETLGRGMSPRYTNGSVRQEMSDGKTGESSEDTTADSKKDPLDGWGTPLGLPSPKPPHKFNLKCAAAIQSSDLGAALDNDVRRQHFDPTKDWGEPLSLPSPAPTTNEISNKGTPGTPKKEKKQARKILSENLKNKKRSESPGKNEKKMKDSRNKIQPVYMDLTYVPHHGNSYYTSLEFFKRIRARYYVFSGTEPSREVYDALLEAKRTWEDKDLEVTMIPTYDTDTLGYWVADNEEALAANHIDLSPSASRCTINLQDHETSCSAYRLEF